MLLDLVNYCPSICQTLSNKVSVFLPNEGENSLVCILRQFPRSTARNPCALLDVTNFGYATTVFLTITKEFGRI